MKRRTTGIQKLIDAHPRAQCTSIGTYTVSLLFVDVDPTRLVLNTINVKFSHGLGTFSHIMMYCNYTSESQHTVRF